MDEPGVLRRIVWREICPWLLLARTFRLAISPPLLGLALAGVLLMPVGAWLAQRLFGGEPAAVLDDAAAGREPLALPWRLPAFARDVGDSLWQPYWALSEPLVQLADPRTSINGAAAQLFVLLWNIALWSLVGTAVARVAVVRLATDDRVGLVQAVRFSIRRFGWSVLAPLFPLVGTSCAFVPLFLLGLVMRLNLGLCLGGLVWGLALLAGMLMALLLLGLAAGWPLMWPTIAAERTGDAFEAFSRSFSYVFGRPLHYLFYIAVAAVIGWLGLAVVSLFVDAALQMTHVAAAWGMSHARLENVLHFRDGGAVFQGGAALVWGWERLLQWIPAAYRFSYFFVAFAAIYLLIRRDVDQTDLDEVHLETPVEPYPLPTLEPAPAGATTEASSSPTDEATPSGDAQ